MEIVIGLLLGVAFLYFLLLIPAKPIDEQCFLTDYAHRGLYCGTIPENSLAAFSAAAEAGFGIELDLQLSRDGEVMVFHDRTLLRMTGDNRRLSECTCAELKQLRLNGTEETIPRLAEVLEVVGSRVPLLIEFKGTDLCTEVCRRAAECLQTYSGVYCVESFHPLYIRWFAKHMPQVARGLLYAPAKKGEDLYFLHLLLNTMALNRFAKPHFIAHYTACGNKFPIAFCRRLFRMPVFWWTVCDSQTFAKAHQAGAYSIFESFLPS